MAELVTTEAEAPSAAARNWVEVFAGGWRAPSGPDAFAEHFRPWLEPDVRLIQPQMPVLVGYEAFREGFARPMFELIDGLHGEVLGWAARGEVLYIEVLLRGSLGGRPVELRSCDRIRLRGERAAERLAYSDPLPLMQASALTPRAWPALLRFQIRQLRNRRRFR